MLQLTGVFIKMSHKTPSKISLVAQGVIWAGKVTGLRRDKVRFSWWDYPPIAWLLYTQTRSTEPSLSVRCTMHFLVCCKFQWILWRMVLFSPKGQVFDLLSVCHTKYLKTVKCFETQLNASYLGLPRFSSQLDVPGKTSKIRCSEPCTVRGRWTIRWTSGLASVLTQV